jgi:hypothetical protein
VSPITLALTSPTNWILVAVNLPNNWRREENRREIIEKGKEKKKGTGRKKMKGKGIPIFVKILSCKIFLRGAELIAQPLEIIIVHLGILGNLCS